MKRTLFLIASSALAGSCYGGADFDVEPVGTARSEVLFGVVVMPWATGSVSTPQRAIVQIGGCTGTVIAPQWVLSAQHCGFRNGATVTSIRPSVNVVRTVDRVINHPTVDAVMLHLSTAMPGMPTVNMTAVTATSLVGQSVTCYGYGARQAVPSTNRQCPFPWWLETVSGMCFLGSNALRSGTNMTRADSRPEYFQTITNARAQMTVPGDSGGPCFLGSELAGVNSGWFYDLSGSSHVYVREVRRWIDRVMRPAVRADYDGDGKTDLAVYRPSLRYFLVLMSRDGFQWSRQMGVSTDRPVLGDFDGDGRTDPAMWSPSTGRWTAVSSATNETISGTLGGVGDIPVPGDYDGDGKTDFAVWHPSLSRWEYRRSSDGLPSTVWWGFEVAAAGDVPVPGNYDGDLRTDLAMWRPSTGEWRVKRSSDDGIVLQQWGDRVDTPVPADYDGDGRHDFAVWRSTDSFWYVLKSSTGEWTRQGYGNVGDALTRGDYNGDGRSDVACHHPSTGVWYIWPTGGNTAYSQQWGAPGDIVLPSLAH